MKQKILIYIILTIFAFPFLFFSFQYFSRAAAIKANIVVDVTKTSGPFPDRWKALAQGGEESGVRMFANVIPQLSELYPSYIRIDHVYDFYDVVSRDASGNLSFSFDKLDQTVCDIYHTGAKPFFSLGYMPQPMSDDGSLIGKPKNWKDWSLLVQKTVERYSGQTTVLPCGIQDGFWRTDIYYEVWNEPDLETFGRWSLYGGNKDYKTLYYYSVVGAQRAQNIYRYFIGGPATTAAYRNWFMVFADYVLDNKLRIDFLSWHHYSKNPGDFYQDLANLNQWLADDKYLRFRNLPKIISEWGYDSNPNPIADTNVGAAHTVASIRNLVEQQLELAFAFEIKDGQTSSWGVLSANAQKKPRYFALKLLNLLDRAKLQVEGEGTFVHAIASSSYNKTTLILVNYDSDNRNNELVPVTFNNLSLGSYKITETNLQEKTVTVNLTLTEPTLKKSVLMQPNSVVAIEIIKQ